MKKRAEEEGETTTRRERSSQVMARDARLLIVGAPGEGKSTLLRHHLLEAAVRWRERPTEHPFPIFVRLADWEAEGGASDGRLFRFLGNRLPAMGEIGSKAVEQWLKGPVLWLLDGIDEIRDAGERVRLVEEVKATSAVRIHDRWIVSTRPAGEPRGGLGAGWTRAVLPSLSDAQVEGVLARWGNVLKAKEGLILDARQMARDLRKDPGLRQVRTNALLLTLAILFFKIRKRLPHDRWEFYDAAEKALRDSWVNYRIRSAERYLPGDYLPELLESLALSGMENGHVLFPREALKMETRAVLAERGYTGGEQSEEIGRFLRAAEDLIGVLVEQGPNWFGFLHLTFQEFYAARAIIHRSGDAGLLIARYWDHPDWREVWPLYALAVQNEAAKFQHLFQTILASGDDLDAQLFRPQLACLRLAGLGGAPLPPAITPVLDWAVGVLNGTAYPLFEIMHRLAAWERRLTAEVRDTAARLAGRR